LTLFPAPVFPRLFAATILWTDNTVFADDAIQ
jgi:hypothetical protein